MKFTKSILILAVLFALALPAMAQTDLTGRLPVSTLAATTTNTTPATSPIGWNKDQVIVFQLTTTGTNANFTNAIVFKFDTGNDNTYWSSTRYSISHTPTGSNTYTTIARLTNSVGAKWLRVDGLENPNASAGSIRAFNYIQ